jgi:anti-anti-sigma factor
VFSASPTPSDAAVPHTGRTRKPGTASSPGARRFWIDVSWSGGTATVAAHGRLDARAAPELAARLSEIIDVACQQRLVVDLADVRHVDRAGATAIVSSGTELPGSGAQLVIRSIPHAAMRYFQVTGLSRTTAAGS